MQIIHDLCQAFLGLILPRHIGKIDALRRFDVDLGVGLSKSKGHGVGTAGPVHQFFGHKLSDCDKHHQRQDPRQQEGQNGRLLLDFLSVEGNTGVVKALRQVRVLHHSGFIDGGLLFVGK